ncbi:MAG TPA: FUSC family protein [Steroidobacteraceae bacterium]|nr:FUSC family protein [Steroidobacteraceae bacterium]
MTTAVLPWKQWVRRTALDWLFVVRTLAGALLALAIALRLDLSSPGSAAVTVAIIALPQTGMVLEKSFYRFLGTLLGAIVTLCLVAVLAQHQYAFIAAVAAWIGLCTAASARFPGFRAYGWLLCGYTTALVGVPAFLDANHAFDIAVDRVTIVSVGILSAGIVNAIFNPSRSTASLDTSIRNSVETLVRARDLIGARADTTTVEQQLQRLSLGLVELESARSSGVFEDPVTRIRSRRIRLLVEHLMVARGRLDVLHRQLQRTANDPVATLLSREADEEVQAVLDVYAKIDSLDTSDLRPVFTRATIAVDAVQALVAGTRAALTVLLCTAFWILSEWPDGLLATVFATVGCAVLAATPNPVRAAWQMGIGAALGVLETLVCDLYILPAANDFVTLALALVPFMAVAAWQMTRPALVLQGGSCLLIFLMCSNLTGVMHYDVVAILNSGVAALAGQLVAMVSLAVIGPSDPAWRARRIMRRLLGTLRLARSGELEHLRTRFHHEVQDLTTQLIAVRATNTQSAQDEKLASNVMEIGDAIIRLRHEPGSPELERCLDDVVAAAKAEDTRAFASLETRLAALREPGAPVLRLALQALGDPRAA